MSTIRLFDSPVSGNCYKVRLLLAHLGRPYERVHVDVLGERPGAVKTKNPAGRVPLLELEDGRFLAESNAILFYLAEGTPYLPEDRYERARTLQWLFFEQNLHEPNVAGARFVRGFLGPDHPRWADLPRMQKAGEAAIAAMERHLGDQRHFPASRLTIADMALYAYTHVAGEAGIDLERYPRVQAWLARVEAEPGHVPMKG